MTSRMRSLAWTVLLIAGLTSLAQQTACGENIIVQKGAYYATWHVTNNTPYNMHIGVARLNNEALQAVLFRPGQSHTVSWGQKTPPNEHTSFPFIATLSPPAGGSLTGGSDAPDHKGQSYNVWKNGAIRVVVEFNAEPNIRNKYFGRVYITDVNKR